MNAFPGMGNVDPSKMDPAQLKQMLNLFSGMSDDQIKNTMKMMGIDMDPSVIRQFVDQLKMLMMIQLINSKSNILNEKLI